ncbi:MAG: hypothetical protein BAJALOKI2v1_290030 [Promethearchaeota archaeon]|nr:MAG: hypothetical protein BAJALOKI2v1_290030 [Candidatus Lokiarchaeota archaeon]
MRDVMKYTSIIKPHILKLRKHAPRTNNSLKYLPKMVNQVIDDLPQERLQKKVDIQIIQKINLGKDLNKISQKVLAFFDKHKELKGSKNPQIFTAATIYTADLIIAKFLGHKKVLTQRMVSEATDIPEYLIRDHYISSLKPNFSKFIPTKKVHTKNIY